MISEGYCFGTRKDSQSSGDDAGGGGGGGNW